MSVDRLWLRKYGLPNRGALISSSSTQRRNDGGKGGTTPLAPNDCGERLKVQQCQKYCFQYSTLASFRTWGRQTCFLPRAPSNLVTPLSPMQAAHHYVLCGLIWLSWLSTSLSVHCELYWYLSAFSQGWERFHFKQCAGSGSLQKNYASLTTEGSAFRYEWRVILFISSSTLPFREGTCAHIDWWLACTHALFSSSK